MDDDCGARDLRDSDDFILSRGFFDGLSQLDCELLVVDVAHEVVLEVEYLFRSWECM